jgi:thioester reductase-like protein
MCHIFLTGGTGVIGSALIPQLLANDGVRLTVLVRAESPAHLESRAHELTQFCDVKQDADIGRLRFMAGDACRERFALPTNDYSDLVNTITGIIHCAGVVKLNQSLTAARRDAVDPVEHVLRLAQSSRKLRKIDAVSTIGVAGRLPGVIPEQRLSCERQFHNTYEQGKAEAEELLWRGMEHGMPITIHRPSMVVGDSRNGAIPHFQVFYYLCDFLTGARTFGLLPNFGQAALDIVTSDYVANVICHTAVHEAEIGKVLHLCAGDLPDLKLAVLANRVRIIYSSLGRPCRVPRHLPLSTFKRLVQVWSWLGTKRMRKMAGALPFFLTYLDEAQSFSVQLTSELLKNQCLAPKPVDEYLPNIIAPYVLRTQPRIPRPAASNPNATVRHGVSVFTNTLA